MSLTRIPCSPHVENIFDAMDCRQKDVVVTGYWVRLWDEEQPPIPKIATQIGPSQWVMIVPDYDIGGANGQPHH